MYTIIISFRDPTKRTNRRETCITPFRCNDETLRGGLPCLSHPDRATSHELGLNLESILAL